MYLGLVKVSLEQTPFEKYTPDPDFSDDWAGLPKSVPPEALPVDFGSDWQSLRQLSGPWARLASGGHVVPRTLIRCPENFWSGNSRLVWDCSLDPKSSVLFEMTDGTYKPHEFIDAVYVYYYPWDISPATVLRLNQSTIFNGKIDIDVKWKPRIDFITTNTSSTSTTINLPMSSSFTTSTGGSFILSNSGTSASNTITFTV